MRGGQLRETVVIKRATSATDSGGGGTDTFAAFHTARCSIDDQWARERLAASGLQAEGGTTILIRWFPGITAGMIAVVANGPFAGEYNIRGVLPVKARGVSRVEALALACERGTAR